MNRYWMCVGSVGVAVETSLDLRAAAAEIRANGGSLLYRLKEIDNLPSDVDAATVFHRDQFAGAICAEYLPAHRQLRISANADDLSGEDLLFLSYLLLEARLNRYGLITLHAAAAERDGQAVLLLGHSGAGKTTTALQLCRRHGFRLIGNDLVVVGGLGELVAVSGTTHVRLRHASVSRAMPEILELFPAEDLDPWRSKVDLMPCRLGIEIADRPAAIAAVVFVHVDSEYPQTFAADGDTLVHRLNLYENSLRHVRSSSTPWLIGASRRFGPFVPSFDDHALHEARTATLNRLLLRSRYVAGTARDVAAHVAGLVGNGTAGTSKTTEGRG